MVNISKLGDTPFYEGIEQTQRRQSAERDARDHGEWERTQPLETRESMHTIRYEPRVITWNIGTQSTKAIVHPPRFRVVAEIPELEQTVTLEWNGSRFESNDEALAAKLPNRPTLELVAKTGQQAMAKGFGNRAFQEEVGVPNPIQRK